MLELFRGDLGFPEGARPLNASCQFAVSRFFVWLSLSQVVDDSVMVCGLPSGVVPGYL